MFRDRPLTWLFVIATVCVDVVGQLLFDSIQFWLAFGQLSAVAIWLVMGKVHRLARFGVFLAVISFVAGRSSNPGDWIFPENFFLTMLVVYTVCVVLAVCPIVFFRFWIRSRKQTVGRKNPWQFPLIELFGWTIIVAYASFACRFLNLESIWHLEIFQFVSLIIPKAILAAIFLENTNPVGHWLRVVKFVCALLIWILCILLFGILSDSASELVALLAVSGGYLVAWSTVRTLDQRIPDMRELLQEENLHANEPKLFNPQD